MNSLINNRDLRFQLYEVCDAEALIGTEKFADHSKQTFDAVLETAEKIAGKYFANHNSKADQNEPQFIDGKVQMIAEVKQAFDVHREAGLIAAGMDYDYGGMQLPFLITLASSGYFMSANPSTTGYSFLTTGAANLINAFASDEQKNLFIKKMASGKFSGTMALTEPNAGSSLSDIVTQAVKQDDGNYKIKGQKIFISGGDHQLTDNIIHLVLAKIKGAAAGVKGISLFIVPKYRLDANGEVAESNDVNLSGLFHKMGYRGTTSTILNFGETDDCIGYLVGEPHQGLKYMFHMMNEARLSVGFGAAMIGYRGFMESLAYAKERPQGRKPTEKNPTSPQVNIIEHADVKRMLLAQKSFVEGGMALCFYSAILVDDSENAEGEDKQQAQLLLDLLMPIVKACCSDYGLKANELAIQILGGSGYTHEYPVEQCYRDNRLNPIHEGTNGIQALDLLGRKVWLNQGEGLKLLFKKISQDIHQAKDLTRTVVFAEAIQKAQITCQEVTQLVAIAMQKEGAEKTLANASAYLTMMGQLVFSWIWLRQATVAEQALQNEKNEEEISFYQGKLQAAQYFVRWELPKLYHNADLVKNLDDTCLAMEPDWF
ncbi:MAG: acyl-CoA dehydrogenase [Enterobacterales bacterium]|nr:acyl-CoA dehydrogenase [Enterobacterales bacterium]